MDKTQFEQSIQKSKKWFESQLKEDGQLKDADSDIAAYFTLPYLLHDVAAKSKAYLSLNYILSHFSTADGGIRANLKDSRNQVMAEELTMVMSWLGVAAHQMGRYEVSFAFSRYLRNYYDPEQGAFTAIAPYGRVESVLDLHSTTQLGWLALTTGDLKKAQRAGNFLQRVISLQSTKDQVFYLRIEEDGKLITNCAEKDESYYWVLNQKGQNNLHYLSMTVIFLSKLFHATNEESYLRSAQAFFETIQSYAQDPDPLVGWGAATLANITKENRYIEEANNVLRKVMDTQSSEGDYNLTRQGNPHFSNAITTIALNESLMELLVI